ncbi:MAG: 3-deoxy-D-manno-octulosonic acid transferase, partial [Bacteroidia bacterium]
PAHAKFQEIGGLNLCGGAFAITSGEELKKFLPDFLSDNTTKIQEAGFEAGKFTLDHTGATEKIMRVIGPRI